MRLINFIILGALGATVLSAASVNEIGANTTNGISTGGLTLSYITGNGGSNPGSYAEDTYATNLFTNDVITAGTSSLGGVLTPTSANSEQQFTDTNNGVVFAMMSDGSNYLGSPATSGSAVNASITIPIGLGSLASASILLNDYYGVNGVTNNDTVTFNFSGAGGSVAVNLSNGNQIDSAQNCKANSTADLTAPVCTSFASTTSNAGGGSATISTVTDVAWSAMYTNSVSNTSIPYSLTSGGLQLDDITFNIGAYAAYTLNSITIADNDNLKVNSRLALSAITVSTPEPSTVFLLFAGLGILCYLGRRQKVQL